MIYIINDYDKSVWDQEVDLYLRIKYIINVLEKFRITQIHIHSWHPSANMRYVEVNL